MKTIYLFIILTLSLCSCGSLRQFTETAKSFTFCYDNTDTGIDKLLNFNGFYYDKNLISSETSADESNKKYASGNNFIFYRDGIFVKDISAEWFDNGAKGQAYADYYYGAEWGRYVISGDTIKIQHIEPLGGASWGKKETWFKIIDNNTIQRLYYKHKEPIVAQEVNKYMQNLQEKDFVLYSFISLQNIPDPNQSWLKNEKWFWCDKKAFKAWKKEQKKRK